MATRRRTWRQGNRRWRCSSAAVAVYHDEPHGSPRNTVEVTVAELDSRGAVIRVRADERPDGAPGLAADITAESAAELRLAPGDRVYFLREGPGGRRSSKPVTEWFTNAINGCDSVTKLGVQVGSIAPRNARDLVVPAIAINGDSL